MIKIENVKVEGLEPAIRGMRNPKNSWDKSDSHVGLRGDGWEYDPGYIIGENDHDLMMRLSYGGPVHAKYRRMIVVWCDITAPLYWWKEFDTYKVGTVANSCSTMHKIAEKEFTEDDFSIEHLFCGPLNHFSETIALLNHWRNEYHNAATEERKKQCWWQMIQLLPSSYNQKRTVMMSYENLAAMHQYRRNHKQDEWREFCAWSETLPYSEVFIDNRVEKLSASARTLRNKLGHIVSIEENGKKE